MSQTPVAPPRPSRAEIAADGVMHALGLGGALVGVTCLLAWAATQENGAGLAALGIYGAALIACFAASAAYHMSPWEHLRPRFRKLDHALIYIKIAGTYTPLVAMIGTLGGYVVLALVWVLALIGAARKLWFWDRAGEGPPWLYLGIGWLAVTIAWPVAAILPVAALVLIAVGGLLYTLGTAVFFRHGLRFANAIWHGFVLAASSCFFAAIALGASALPL